jgi:hypothetical protein
LLEVFDADLLVLYSYSALIRGLQTSFIVSSTTTE